MAYSVDELFGKLERADAAGDVEAARVIADEIRKVQAGGGWQPAKRSGADIRAMAGRVDPTEGMSRGGKFMAGVGKSLVDTAQGVGQLVGAVGQDAVNMRQQRDAPLLNDGWGMGGNIAGQIGQMAIPASGVARGVSYAGRGAAALKAGLSAGAFAATQPVAEDQSRLGNVAYNAVAGAAGQQLSTGLGALAKGTTSRLGAEASALAQKAEQYGIRLGMPQLSDNSVVRTVASQMERLPFSGARKAAEGRQVALNRAVGDTFGSPEDKITPDVFAKAADRIGNEFNTIAARNSLPASPQLLSRLGSIRAEAEALAGTKEAAQVNNWITRELLGKADANGVIPGAAYKSFDSRIGKATASGGEAAHYLGQVREAVREAMDNAISPRDKAAWDLARRQWASLKTVEPLVAKATTGDISPASLMGRVTADKAGKARMAKDRGGQLGDLARIGQRFLKESPNSGTADRLLVNGAVAGGLYGLQDRGVIDPDTALLIGGGLAANRVGLGVLNSKALARGGSPTLNGLARLAKPAPQVLPAWLQALRSD